MAKRTETNELPGISIQRLAQVAAERAANRTGASVEELQASIFDSLRELAGWKLFDREAA